MIPFPRILESGEILKEFLDKLLEESVNDFLKEHPQNIQEFLKKSMHNFLRDFLEKK